MKTVSTGSSYPCPCCGFLVFQAGPGSYDICPFCFWEDDALQLEFATTLAGGANHPTLEEAQRNFQSIGASEARLREYVRSPPPSHARDPEWRPIDRTRDAFADFDDSLHERAPSVDESLYYWRRSFWRRRPGDGTG